MFSSCNEILRLFGPVLVELGGKKCQKFIKTSTNYYNSTLPIDLFATLKIFQWKSFLLITFLSRLIVKIYSKYDLNVTIFPQVMC